MNLSHKIKLYPNASARSYFERACGTARFAYNWGLAQALQDRDKGLKTPSGFDIHKRLTSVKKTEFPWMYELSKWIPQYAIYNVEDAFKRFFGKVAKFPKFKSKRRSKKTFSLGQAAIKVQGKRLKIANLDTRIKMAQEIRFPGKILAVTVSQDSDGAWYASFSIEVDSSYQYPHQCETQALIGIDVGLQDFCVTSTGERVSNPRFYRKLERKLARAQRALARCTKGSNRRARAKLAVGKVHAKIRRKRLDFLHQLSSRLVREYRTIGVESQNVKGLVRTRLAKSVSDAGWSEFKRQLEYKSTLSGSLIVHADRFYPSSKTCHVCQNVRDSLSLSEREWMCTACGAQHDRDLNAARNLAAVALRHRETENAHGEDVRPPRRKPRRRTSVKCESTASINLC